MLFLAVDDEQLLLDELVRALKQAEPKAEIAAFQKSVEALNYAKGHRVDIAFLDINMRGIDGISLAKHLKGLNPDVNIIFCTGYSDYYADAFKVKASGYLLKPITAEEVRKELDDLRRPLLPEYSEMESVYLKCFGRFEVFYQGQVVQFKNGKTKELLAYLVDQEGVLVNNRTIESALWNDMGHHISYIKKLKHDLADTLKQHKISGILERRLTTGEIGIVKDKVRCDYYDWQKNDPEAVKAFFGEYMEDYSWAEGTKSRIMQSVEV